MKRVFLIVISLLTALSLSACDLTRLLPKEEQKTPSGNASFVSSQLEAPAEFPPADTDPFSSQKEGEEEVRAVWLSYLELKPMFSGDFSANIKSCFETIKNNHLNTVFVQVRPFSDALYPSKIFPWSHIITGKTRDMIPCK